MNKLIFFVVFSLLTFNVLAAKGKQKNWGGGQNGCIGNGGLIICYCYGADHDLGSRNCNAPACSPKTQEGGSCGIEVGGKVTKGSVSRSDKASTAPVKRTNK